MPAAPNNIIVLVVLVSLVAWRMYARVRRNIGPQKLRPKRMMASIVIFGVLVLIFGVASLLKMKLVLGLGAGLLLGVPLGLLGLHLTRFERVAGVQSYTPNVYIGAALSLLVAVRLIYRMMVLSKMAQSSLGQSPQPMQSALTLFFFGLLAGYYIAYYSGVLIRCRTLAAADVAV